MWKHRSSTPGGLYPAPSLKLNHKLLQQGTGTADHPLLLWLFQHGFYSLDHLSTLYPYVILSRALRDSTPRFVSPSVHRSVDAWITLYFFGFLRSLASLLLDAPSSDLNYGPCPPACVWGSCVSVLVKQIKLWQPAWCHFEDLLIFHSVTLNFFGVYEVFGLTAPAQMLYWPQMLPLSTHTWLG